MEHEIDLVFDLTDLDREGRMPMSTLLLWAQKCRVALYHDSALVLALRESVGTFMVKAQRFDVLAGETLKLNSKIKVQQHVSRLGKTSIVLDVEFSTKADAGLDGNRVIFARGEVILVCVAQGRAREIPELFRSKLVVGDSRLPPPPINVAIEAPVEHLVRMEIQTRSSDEDTNLHVKHVRYCHFLEDCLAQLPRLICKQVQLTYLKECRRGETLLAELQCFANKTARFNLRNALAVVVFEAQVYFL